MDILTKSEENFCENAGLIGVLLSLACLVQHLLFMVPHWITFSIIGIYILPIISFILLMKKKVLAPRLIIISLVLVFLVEMLLILSLAFSLVLILLFVYLVSIVAILYSGDIVSQLKRKDRAQKEEAAKWNGIV